MKDNRPLTTSLPLGDFNEFKLVKYFAPFINTNCPKKIINELDENIIIPDNENYNLILTPKEIDEDIEHLSTLIATSINQYIQEDFTSM